VAGDEQVLDVGCGRGLMLIGAAKRLTTGKATGIDVWQAEDLFGEPARGDADQRRAGGRRRSCRDPDRRHAQAPVPDATFDVVVSRAAIHNLYTATDRAQAIGQIARVLKPGGQALIDDIRHHREYVATFAANRCKDVRWLGSPSYAWP